MRSKAEEGDVGIGLFDETFEGGVSSDEDGGCGLVADIECWIEGEGGGHG